MSEYNSTAKNVLAAIFGQVCAAASLGAFFLLGFFLRPPFAVPLCVIFAVLFFAFFLWGFIRTRLRGKQLAAMRAEEINTFLLEKREEITQRTDEEARKLRRVARRGLVFLLAELAFMHASALFLGATGVAECAELLIIGYLPLTGVYLRLIAAFLYSPRVARANLLSRESFGALYGLAQRAADALEVRGKILLITDESFSASIFSENGKIYVLLGAAFVAALSEGELYNVLLHEMAHVSPKHTPKGVSRFYHRFMDFEFPTGISFDFLVVYSRAIYMEQHFLYTLLASATVEARADAVVLEKGNPSLFAAALAKSQFALSYDRVAYAYLDPPLYFSEEPEQTLATRRFAAYRAAVAERADAWLDQYEREIRARMGSHPVYRERRDAVGVTRDEVKICFDFPHDALAEERERLLSLADGMLLKSMTPNYQEIREEMIVAPTQTVEAYEKNKAEYTTSELTPVIDALGTLSRFDEAENICDEILAKEENRYATAYARFFKGMIRLLNDDPAGIPLLYEAAELNECLAEDSYNSIGDFTCRCGLEKELEEYRARALVLTQKEMDEKGEANALTPRDRLSLDPMEAEKREKIVSFATEAAPEISAIYLVRKTVAEERYVHMLVLEFAPKTDMEKMRGAFEKLNLYLNAFDGERYSLFLAIPQFKKIVKRVKGSLIYSKPKK